ncbi:hypothetical protein VTO42DRAFT_4833 [Malbranchea cinnamomea]
MGSKTCDLFEVNTIQDTPIGPSSLIPTINGSSIAFKKIDLAVVFSEANSTIESLYEAVRIRHPLLRLSQSDRLDPGKYSQFLAIEVKSLDGSYYAASVQLAVWLAAGLQKMKLLRELATEMRSETEPSPVHLLPFMAIAVSGHVWNLHIASKADDGVVVRFTSPLLRPFELWLIVCLVIVIANYKFELANLRPSCYW